MSPVLAAVMSPSSPGSAPRTPPRNAKRRVSATQAAPLTPPKRQRKVRESADQLSTPFLQEAEVRELLRHEPVQPSPPPTALAVFMNENFSAFVGNKRERLKVAMLMWNALSPNDKLMFQYRALELKEQYETAFEKYQLECEEYRKAAPFPVKSREALCKRARAREQKHKFQALLKEVSDRLKDKLQCCRIGGWRKEGIPDGQLQLPDVDFDFFAFAFRPFKPKFFPENCNADTPVVSLELSGKEAAAVFGTAKLRSGSTCAKFAVSGLSATYRPSTRSLHLDFGTEYTCRL